jgi:hypothetical protein
VKNIPRSIYGEDHPWRKAPRWYFPVATTLVFGTIAIYGVYVVLRG